jgi:xylan 1,4-beta-xylosidase
MSIVRVFSLTIAVAAFAAPTGNSAAQDQTIDFANSIGKIRSIHGVVNGPVNFGIGADLTNYHKEAGFPSARLSDCIFGGIDAVDIHCIFPFFDADADDPKYYTFAKTDAYIGGIVKNGTQITYRLAESIECRLGKYFPGGLFTRPPKDNAKWAKVCVNIIRHYNEGWANGFHYNIKYFEIGSEPEDGPPTWAGTLPQFYELYAVTAKAIKAHDLSLKVGGAASNNWPGMEPFLAFCRERRLPLDFVTWHCYVGAPRDVTQSAVSARKLIDQYGFKNAESHVTEWHPMWYPWVGSVDANELGNPDPKKYATMREKYDTMRGPKAAAFAASALMLLQDCPLDMGNYYTADTNPWGMFDSFGVPGRAYYAFVAFNQLTKTPNRVACTAQGTPQPEITMCAGLSDDRKSASILVSNFGDAPRKASIRLKSLPLPQPVQVETFAVDATHEFTSIEKNALHESLLTLKLSGNGVYLVRIGAGSAEVKQK